MGILSFYHRPTEITECLKTTTFEKVALLERDSKSKVDQLSFGEKTWI
jgi:hypothetical protein